jgi:hypothetical protein
MHVVLPRPESPGRKGLGSGKLGFNSWDPGNKWWPCQEGSRGGVGMCLSASHSIMCTQEEGSKDRYSPMIMKLMKLSVSQMEDLFRTCDTQDAPKTSPL